MQAQHWAAPTQSNSVRVCVCVWTGQLRRRWLANGGTDSPKSGGGGTARTVVRKAGPRHHYARCNTRPLEKAWMVMDSISMYPPIVRWGGEGDQYATGGVAVSTRQSSNARLDVRKQSGRHKQTQSLPLSLIYTQSIVLSPLRCIQIIRQTRAAVCHCGLADRGPCFLEHEVTRMWRSIRSGGRRRSAYVSPRDMRTTRG